MTHLKQVVMKRLNIFIGATALAALFLTAAINVNAQENGNRDEFGNIVRGPYETNRFGDNWFIGAGGGVNFFIEDGFGAKVAPSLDVNLGKWFTPSIGMRVGYQGLNSRVSDGDIIQKFGYMYIHGDFLWNISNALSGYKETRFWNFVPYLHAGFYRSDGIENVDVTDNEFAAGGGLLHNLRLTDRLDLIVDMRATVVSGSVHGSAGVAVVPSVTMGMAVDLGWPNFVRTSTILGAVEAANLEKVAIVETAMVALEAANAALEAENTDLQKTNSNLKKQISDLQKMETVESEMIDGLSPMTVYFQIGKAVLDEKELQHLDYFASKVLDKVTDGTKITVTVMGTADSNTGTQSRNKFLSEARGKYVTDLLKDKYGISTDRMTVRSEVINATSKPELSRSVVISF